MKENSNGLTIEMGRFFDERASTYDNHQKQTVSYFDSLHKAVAGAIEESCMEVKVLDLGSGTGIELEWIFARVPNARVTCIDISDRMLDELKGKYETFLEQIEVIKGSFLDMSFQENYFDYVVSVLTMHHYTYEQKLDLYTKIRKALVPGGKYIEGDHVLPPEEEKKRLAWYRRQLKPNAISPDKIYHIDIPFSITSQRKVLFEAGFSEVEILFETEYAAALSAC
jgi:tRNA (cmo5U34)-methyltransferase